METRRSPRHRRSRAVGARPSLGEFTKGAHRFPHLGSPPAGDLVQNRAPPCASARISSAEPRSGRRPNAVLPVSAPSRSAPIRVASLKMQCLQCGSPSRVIRIALPGLLQRRAPCPASKQRGANAAQHNATAGALQTERSQTLPGSGSCESNRPEGPPAEMMTISVLQSDPPRCLGRQD